MSRYIDADDYEVQLKIDNHLNGYTDLSRALHILRHQKTADVRENVRGSWKYSHANCYVCSICGHCISIDDQAKNDWYRHNYCGHCGSDNHWESDGYGADMRTD